MLQQALRQLAEQLGPLLILVVAWIFSEWKGWMQKLRDRNKFKLDPTRDVRRDRELDILLAQMGIECDSIRTYIVKFHNGSHYVDGSDILRKTRTNEWVGDGASNELRDFENILTSRLSDEMALVAAGRPIVCKVLEDLQRDSRFRRMMLNGGTQVTIRCALKSRGNIIGFIGLDYDDIDASLPDLEIVADYASRIELVLENGK